jgi:apolipoprotein N-acyltransferase
VALGVAFLPGPFGFLAWFALVPLLVALNARVTSAASGRRLFGLGYLFGFVFFLIGMHWVALLADVAITVSWLKYLAWIAAAAYLALYPAFATWCTGWVVRRTGLSLAIVFPFVWMAAEVLRASGELGFPWFQPGYTQHAYAPVIQMASLGGATLVTFWLLWLNVLIWQALRGRNRLRTVWAAALLFLLPWFWGRTVLATAPATTGPPIALVQGNIPGEIKWSGEHQLWILQTFIELSQGVTADGKPAPALIIWPETATGSYMRKRVDQALAVSRAAVAGGSPIFSGFADWSLDSTGQRLFHNAAGQFGTDGSLGAAYAKRHLVPFGERMPFQWLIPGIGKLELGQAEWTPGTEEVLFENPAGRYSALICFESIYADLARNDVRAGAEWLVNITNDEWFGNSAALYQHAAMASFRAVENHVPLARCANTGLTLMIDAYGRVVARLPVFETGVLVAPLPVRAGGTPFTRFGDWVAILAVGATLLLAGRAATRR